MSGICYLIFLIDITCCLDNNVNTEEDNMNLPNNTFDIAYKKFSRKMETRATTYFHGKYYKKALQLELHF